jgi:hypothetical protein
VKDETKTVHIADGIVLGFHVFDIDDLRGYIARCTTTNKQVFFSV